MPDFSVQPVQTIALLGSYVPRRCGIATFTNDLREALAIELGERETTVLALDDTADGYDYPREVRLQIPQHSLVDYVTAADLLNINQIDVVSIQHEFGIYGGRDGSHVLELVRRLRMPVITTLHTVLSEPSPSQRAVMKELIRCSDKLVVMSRLAEKILTGMYPSSIDKLVYIPHGIPDVPFVDSEFFRDQFGVEGRRVLLTFGLIGAGKGIEVAIRAMPQVVAKHPDVLYIVLGATHPHVLKHEGNAYRASLERLVAQLKMRDHVVFHNRFVTREELIRYLGVADIYITPYPNKQQITSGTLAYALGAGKAVISTPYLYAEEMLDDGRGQLFEFGNADSLANGLNDLLSNDTERNAMRKRAYLFGRNMVWKEVARNYLGVANEILRERQRLPRSAGLPRHDAPDIAALPDVTLAHLQRMSDDTGLLQHAMYAVPDRHHGYCADDNARALIATLQYIELTGESGSLRYLDVYLSFLHHAFNRERNRFRNFLSYDRKWQENEGSEDCHGRCLWALGTAVQMSPSDSTLSLAMRLFHDALPPVEGFSSPRAWAFTLIGLHRFLTRFAGDTQARRMRQVLAERLSGLFDRTAAEDWIWFEDIVTYDNAKLPHALLVAGAGMDNKEMVARALRSLDWLVELQLSATGNVSLIGNNGWLRRDFTRARFDQQPIEAMATVEACAEAYRVTGDDVWFKRARHFQEWFLGNNDTQHSLYNPQTGGCRDGLHSGGPNLNEGAESTMAWLIGLMTIMDLQRARVLAADSAVDRPAIAPVTTTPVHAELARPAGQL